MNDPQTGPIEPIPLSELMAEVDGLERRYWASLWERVLAVPADEHGKVKISDIRKAVRGD